MSLVGRSSFILKQKVRYFSYLKTSEEFPLKFTTTPKITTNFEIKESVLSNGVKIISRNSGSSVSFRHSNYLFKGN